VAEPVRHPHPLSGPFSSRSASPTPAVPVLRGERDWHPLRPLSRWVGAVSPVSQSGSGTKQGVTQFFDSDVCRDGVRPPRI